VLRPLGPACLLRARTVSDPGHPTALAEEILEEREPPPVTAALRLLELRGDGRHPAWSD